MKKQVKDCTIEELEQWFIKKEGYLVPKIEIHWYEVSFYDSDYNIKFDMLSVESMMTGPWDVALFLTQKSR